MSTDETDKDGEKHEPAPEKILELLERLGSGDRLVDAPISMGLSQEDARAIFAKAAEIVRESFQGLPPEKRWPRGGSLLDWQEMTVAEALEILAAKAGEIGAEES